MIPQQNTPEWLAWRKDKIGASDAAIILGISPWTTPYQLWMQKVGLSEGQKENDAMRRGKELEPIALNSFNLSSFRKPHSKEMKPAVVVNPLYNWQIASLDGYNEESFCEIKCPGEKDHQNAIDGKIPQKYIPQLTHQFMVSRCEFAFYVSYRPESIGNEFKVLKLHEDSFKMHYADLLLKEEEFYNRIVNFDPPPMTDKDYQIVDDMGIKSLVNEFMLLSSVNKMNEKIENELRKMIIEGCKGQSSMCNGLKISKFPRRGNIDYSKIPELKGIDLDPYRKPTTDQWRLSYGDTT